MTETRDSNSKEPIAIIGIGCRLPGGIKSPSSFWEFLKKGGNGITDVPTDRWNLQRYYHPDRRKKGRLNSRKGGFLDQIDRFDADFFGISSREAAFMDPQQRLMLEVTWEACEDAGLVPLKLRGSKTGVYVGLFVHDYENMHSGFTEHALHGPHSGIGVSASVVANRISYYFDFKGPSIIIDSACSSSLGGLHYACKDLWSRDTELGVVGGVNLMMRPEMSMMLCKASMLSPDGYCKTFDAEANGYVRSEAATMVILKPLSLAIRDKNPIYSLILSSSVNQDGYGEGLTFPNGSSQESLIRNALQQAGVSAGDIQYLEAHGTGTEVGDPIEANSLGKVLSENRPVDEYCVVGSVKSNIGHTESAAGLAGLIKTALMLKHKRIPPNLHFNHPNPKIPFAKLKLRVPTNLEHWECKHNRSRTAGVNSFGFGGTNAHVIVREYKSASQTAWPQESAACIIPLSAKTPKALDDTVVNFIEFLKGPDSACFALRDIAYSAVMHKSHHNCRLAVSAESRADLLSKLEQYVTGSKQPEVSTGKSQTGQAIKTAFVFSGMGQQWVGMGKGLIKTEPIFHSVIEECDALFRRYTTDWSLVDQLADDSDQSRIHETQIAQPCIVSLQIALSALWRERGFFPDVVVGHSVGEIAACYEAGVVSLEEAIRIAYHRSRLQQETAGQGTMLAVGLSVKEMEQRLTDFDADVAIGAINSGTSLTLSGNEATLKVIARSLETDRVFNRFLNVEVPYHSPMMETILPALKSSLKNLKPRQGEMPLISTVTGEKISGRTIDTCYWQQNVRKPVRFAKAMLTLIQSGVTRFVEISAHPVLSSSIRECLLENQIQGFSFPSLNKQASANEILLQSMAELYCHGFELGWKPSCQPDQYRFVRLPLYPWQHERYWNESESSQKGRLGQAAHPLLGSRLDTALKTWQTQIDRDDLAFLDDHIVQAANLFPATGYIELALAAAGEILKAGSPVIRDFKIERPLLLSKDESVLLQTTLNGTKHFSVFSKASPDQTIWNEHASGTLAENKNPFSLPERHLAEVKTRCPVAVTKSKIYQVLSKRNLMYGPTFQQLKTVWKGANEGVAEFDAEAGALLDRTTFSVHPALLDASLQAMALLSREGTYLPTAISLIEIVAYPSSISWLHVKVLQSDAYRLVADIFLYDEANRPFAKLTGVESRRAFEEFKHIPDAIDNHLFEHRWLLAENAICSTQYDNAGFLSDPVSISQKVETSLNKLTRHYNRREYYQEVGPALDQLALLYFREAFAKLVPLHDKSCSGSLSRLTAKQNIVDQQTKMFRRLVNALENHQILSRDQGGWQLAENHADLNSESFWERCAREYPAYYLELILMKSFGPNLASIFKGETDPLTIVSSHRTTLEQFYFNSFSLAIYCDLARLTFAHLVEDLPPGRKLRVLEIGAGTGGMTAHLAPLFNRFQVEFTFTDISPVYTRQAEIKFKEYKWMQYKTLDIEKAPAAQGFEPRSYDIVLAFSVLHATKDIKEALSHVNELLVTDGIFLLFEVVSATLLLDLIFGTMKGWWAFQDHDLRPNHPLLCEQDWKKVLKTSGFHHPVGLADFGKTSANSLIISKVRKNESNTLGGQASKSTSRKILDSERPGLLLFAASDRSPDFQSKGIDRYFRPIYVSRGKTFSQSNEQRFCIPFHEESFSQLLNSLNFQSKETPVVAFITGSHDSDDSGVDWFSCDEIAVTSNQYLDLIKALMKRFAQLPCSIWNITQNTQPFLNQGTQNIHHATLWGISRVAMNEYPKLKIRSADLSRHPSEIDLRLLFEEMAGNGTEDEMVIKKNNKYLHRLVQKKNFPSASDQQNFSLFKHDASDSFSFREISRSQPGPTQVEIRVKAAALNFKDHAKAIGIAEAKREDDGLMTGFGYEVSGIIERLGSGVQGFKVGDEVIGMGWNGLSGFVLMDSERCVRKPSDLSFEASATIPLVFMTAYYTLFNLAKIQKGENVLIHTAAGGVGLAAIQLAKFSGATVYATAGTKEKRSFLKSLGVRYVSDSRSLEFESEFAGSGNVGHIDVVINTLPDQAIEKSINLLKPFSGRLIDISNFYNESSVSIRCLRKGTALHVIDLEKMADEQPDDFNRLFTKVHRFFMDNAFYTIPHQVFQTYDVKKAFKLMNSGGHIGKICISFRNTPDIIPTRIDPEFDSTASYIICGGFGGFGLEVARWLVECGARHLVLIGRSGASSSEAMAAIQALEKKGANIAIVAADIAQKEPLRKALTDCFRRFPPPKGIVHSAMVLDIALISEMDSSRFARAADPKILGAWNLYSLTADYQLDFFLLFSSINSILGFAGQSNYAAANYFLDMFASYLRQQGVPGVSISWGVLDEAGYFTTHTEEKEHFKKEGFSPLSLKQAWRSITFALEHNLTHVGAFWAGWDAASKYHPLISNSPRLSHLINDVAGKDQSDHLEKVGGSRNLLFSSKEERLSYVTDQVRKIFSEVLGSSSTEKGDDQAFEKFNLDSLLAVELGVRLNDTFGIDLPKVTILQKGLNVHVLSSIIEKEILIKQGATEGIDKNRQDAYAIQSVNLQEEARLSAAIKPVSAPMPFNTKPNKILLTGSTGFLGAYLLRDLLRQSSARIYCLVRSNNQQEGLDRLRDNLDQYNLWNQGDMSRIKVISGDLAQPRLGVDKALWSDLADGIDVIYHNGAWLNFAQPYSILKPANVSGTREIIRLACESKTKTLHYISTLAKLSQTAPDPGAIVEQPCSQISESLYGQEYIQRNGFNVGYHQSKWVADELVIEAGKRGLPTTIFRPALIAGDSNSGAWNTEDYICILLKGLMQMGKAPIQDAYLDFAPVDYYSKAIVALAHQGDSAGKGYVLKNPQPIKWNDFIEWFNSNGYPIQLTGSADWFQELKSYLKHHPQNPLLQLLPLFEIRPIDRLIVATPSNIKTLSLLEKTVTQRLLKKAGITCPAADEKLMKVYSAYLRQNGILTKEPLEN